MTSAASPLRVGVIGLGAMGTSHVETLTRWIPSARVSAGYDADVARADEVCGRVGARVVTDGAGDLIGADDVDAVLIAAPDPLHEQLALDCLAAGKPTFCEKPLATTAEGSRRIVDAEVAAGRRLVQVGFMRRYDPAHSELRRAVVGGAVGRVQVVHCVHRNASAQPTATSEGIVTNSMIHELDTVPWLLDDPWTAVTVTVPGIARTVPGRLLDPQVAVLETGGGVVVTCEVYVNAGYGYDVRCEVVGDTGTARLVAPSGLALRRDGGDGTVVAPDFVVRFADAYRLVLADWVHGVRSGTVTGPTAWDGHQANLAAIAAVESLRSGGRVDVPQEERPSLYADAAEQ